MDGAPATGLTFNLTDEEAEALMNVNVAGQPGEQLHAQICQQLSSGNRELPITDGQLGRVFRIMVWGSGPVQNMAARVFKRSLMEILDRA